jgi:hypothetical protein
VFIVVDALDECRASVRDRQLRSPSKPEAQLFWQHPDSYEIMEQFGGRPSLKICASEADVESYLRGKLEKPPFVRERPELTKEIASTVTEAADGM